MSCYFRHLKDIFDRAGINVDASNRKEIDRVIHDVAGVGYKDCPAAWKRLKQEFLTDEKKRQELVRRLQSAGH